MKSIPLVLMFSTVLAACAQKEIYNIVQQSQWLECQREVRTNAYLECMEQVSMSYEQYQREREAVLRGD